MRRAVIGAIAPTAYSNDTDAPASSEVDLDDFHEHTLPIRNRVLSVLSSTEGLAQAEGSNLPAHGELTVQTWFVAQTLDQMRDGTDLTLDGPPLRLPVTMARCGGEQDVHECTWEDIDALVAGSIDLEHVDPALDRG